MNRNLVLTLLAIGVFAACKKKNDPPPIPYETLTSTTSYTNTFKGTDSASTVNFYEQTLRIKMLKEIEENLLAFAYNDVSTAKLKQMLENTNGVFADSTLNNAIGISILSVFAQSFSATNRAIEVTRVHSWCDSAESAGKSANEIAAQGSAGAIGGSYLVDGRGIEYAQFIKTAITGGMMLDQICNISLGTEKMGADNTTVITGKNYTALEHNWDEAYGYLTQNEYFLKQNSMGSWQEVYLGNYVRQVNSIYGSPTALYLAFLKGRAAIVNKDKATRDQQIALIRAALEKAVATVAVSYLNKSKNGLTEATRFHALSEGVGLIYALRYAYAAKISPAKSDELMNKLMNKPNGFWSLTNSDIDEVRNEMSVIFTVDRDAIVNP